MGIYVIDESGPKEYSKKSVKKEKHIEDFLEKNIKVLDPNIFVIGRQVRTDGNNSIDIMCMDGEGNTVIIELKRGMTARQVISQSLDYAVWAEGADYDTLNGITKDYLGKSNDLYGLFQSKFGSIPDPWNNNQKIYIVAERIDEKTREIASYLRRRSVDIKCAELNFYGGAGKEIIHVDYVVGDLSDTVDEIGERVTTAWEDRLRSADDANRSLILDLISAVQDRLKPLAGPQNQWYYMRVAGKDRKNQFGAIVCNKKSAYVSFRVDPDTFKHDENAEIRSGYRWFFTKEAERKISLTKSNLELILQCLEHSHDITSKL